MKEFITAALPFVLMGLALAIWAVNSTGKKGKQQDKNISQGMALGLLAGVAIGATGVMDYAVCMSLGMLWCIVLGTVYSDRK